MWAPSCADWKSAFAGFRPKDGLCRPFQERDTSLSEEERMQKSHAERLVERLREFQRNTPEVEASVLVSVDGLTIASALPGGIEEDRVSAMSAAMLSLGERIAGELGRGGLEQVYVKGAGGYVLLTAVGTEAVLTALARPTAKLGLVFLEMRRAAEDLEKML